MLWFTIYVESPKCDSPMDAKPNGYGQWLAFDGLTSLDQAKSLARKAAETWQHVQLFGGKMLGKLIMRLDRCPGCGSTEEIDGGGLCKDCRTERDRAFAESESRVSHLYGGDMVDAF